MKKINMIAAIGKNYELGYQNELIWHLKKDMEFFRKTTTGHPIIMGRKTFESLPKLLPNREHLVLSRQNITIPGVKFFSSKEELDNYLEIINEISFVIGGSSLYEMYIPEAVKIYLTEIDSNNIADVFFPKFDKENYEKNLLYNGSEDYINFKINEYTLKRKKLK